jgi:uncharacterized protein (TIGR02145 family)
MKKYILYILIVFTILEIASCKDEEIERDKEVIQVEGEGLIINKETIIIDLDEVGIIDVVTTDTVTYNNQDYALYEVEIEGSIEEAEQIEVGTVLNIPTGNRGGQVMMVYEIIPVEEDRSKGIGAYALKSIQVSLDMYFTYADPIIEFSTPDNRSKKNSVYPDKLTGSELVFSENMPTFESELEGLSFTTSVEQLFEGSLSTKIWKSGDSYIEVNGSFGIHPAIDLFMEYEPQTVSSAALNGIVGLFEAALTPDLALLFSQDKNYVLGNMKQLRAVVYTDVDKEMSVKVHLEKEFDFVKRIPIGQLTIPTVPVSGNIELAFELDFEAMGTLDFETYKKEEYDIVVGVDLQKDLPDPVWYYEKAYREEDGFQLKAKIELTAGVSIILETEIYVLGVIGPEISMEAYVEAKAAVEASVSNENPLEINWELKADAGINGNASLNLAFFHHDPVTWKIWEYPFVKYRENIYTAPDYLKVISGGDQQGDFGMPLTNPIVIGAFDNKDNLIEYLPVPVYFETENGTVNSVDFTEAGNAEANWVLDEENENQTINSYFKFDDVKKGEIQIKATALVHVGPTAPVLLAPINEAIDQEAVNLLIDWEAGDPDESNINYKLYLGESSEFTEADIVFGGIPFTAGEVQLLENTQYFWQVIAIDSEGNETASEVWSFTTQGGGGTIVLTTDAITNITETSVTSGGNITDDGGATITARGVCWSINSDPTISDNFTSDGTGIGTYVSSLIQLTAGITYYVRSYATNSNGTSYGNEQSFTTTQISTDPIVNSVSPLAAILGTETIFTVSGTNLSDDLLFHIDDLENKIFVSLSADKTVFKFKGMPSNSTGTKNGVIKKVDNTELFTFLVDYTENTIVNGTITDIDGNVYQTVIIGTQEWMAKNLKTTRYADGTEIPLVTDNTAWENLGDNDTDDAYCYYNNNANGEKDTYGALYTYASAKDACPSGWHLPNDSEWNSLTDYLGGSAGSKLAGNAVLWNNENIKNDIQFGLSGFSAIPGGGRGYTPGEFSHIGNGGDWWSATDGSDSFAYDRQIFSTSVGRSGRSKSYGFSVRCIKD